MLIKTKKFLEESPHYILAVLSLALKGNPTILEKACNGELNSYRLLQVVKIYQEHGKVFPVSDFPISVSPNGQIVKMPERVLGFILSGQKEFYQLDSPFSPESISGEEWLSQFSEKEIQEIQAEYSLLLETLSQSSVKKNTI